MAIEVELTTTVLPGHRIEITAPQLPEGRAARVRVTVEEPADALEVVVNPDLLESERLYYQDLPKLLQSRPGRWVAYGRDGCIAEGDDPAALYRHCFRQGFQAGHFVVTRVEPDLPVVDLRDEIIDPEAQ
jgi:hypothetical protein